MTNCEPVARRKLLTCQIYGSLKFVLLSRFGDGFTVAELEQLLLKVLDAVFSVNEAASFKTCSRRNAAFIKNIISVSEFSESNQAFSPTPFVQDGACRHPQGVPVHDFSEIENSKFIFFSIFVSVFSPNLTENEAPRFPFLAIGRVWAIWPPQIPILPNSHFIASA